MKITGFALIVLGFLASTLSAVWTTEDVYWLWYTLFCAVAITGIILVRMAHHQMHRSDEKLSSNMQIIRNSLGRIVLNLKDLDQQKNQIQTHTMRHKIDELIAADISEFVQARESIIHAHSMQAYADIMNDFAAAERYLNRTWSASADGYIDEVNEYISKSAKLFETTLARVNAL